jgi:hypothetical protein
MSGVAVKALERTAACYAADPQPQRGAAVDRARKAFSRFSREQPAAPTFVSLGSFQRRRQATSFGGVAAGR